MRIAVLRPSRGLEFAESAQSVELNLQEFGWDRAILRTWSLPIPDSFNRLAHLALDYDADLLWFVEEDVVVPHPGGLKALVELGADIAAINYRLKTDGRISEMRRRGELIWVSLGCTLVKRRVFEALPEPWFSTDYALVSKSTGIPGQRKSLELEYNPRQYAGQDMYFCFRALQAGLKIGVVPGMLCEHLVFREFGAPNTNDGCHKIERV